MTADRWVPGRRREVASPNPVSLDLPEKDEHPGPKSLVARSPQPSAWGLITRNSSEASTPFVVS
jgi:hypothetical protein